MSEERTLCRKCRCIHTLYDEIENSLTCLDCGYIDKWVCEECHELIYRRGNELYCENGCFEDDIRNGFSEDELENADFSNYPKDENADYIKCPYCNKEFEVEHK